MNKILKSTNAIILILIINSSLFCQWTWQMPKPTGEAISDVGFFNPDRYIFIGSTGLILRSNDETSFDSVSSGTKEHLRSIYCFNDNVGWIGSSGEVVLRTEDGGLSWTKAWEKYNAEIASFFAFDSEKAILSETPGELTFTGDGGQNWETMTSDIPENFSILKFSDSLTGYALINSSSPEAHGLFDSIVVKTVDGGHTWDTIPIFFHDRVNFIEVNAGNEVWLGSTEFLYYSDDFGMTWDTIRLPSNNNIEKALSMTFREHDKFWLLCSRPGDWSTIYTIYYSDNNGHTLQNEMEYASGGFIWDCQGYINKLIYNNNRCWAVGYPGLIYSTEDSDTNWIRNGEFLDLAVRDLFFYDDQHGFGVGDYNFLLVTNDGGLNWEIKNSLPPNYYYKVQFLNQNIGFVINLDGGCNRTVDGGITWDTVYDNTYRMVSMDFSGHMGLILDDDGKIYRSKDAGETWKLFAAIPTTASMSDIEVTNDSTAIVVGDKGQIWKSEDGGKSWDLRYSKAGVVFWDVYFVDEHSGWAISQEGIICRSENEGSNWSIIDTVADQPLLEIGFITDKVGYLTTEMGGLYRTADGGFTWNKDLGFNMYNGSLAINGNNIWLASNCQLLHKFDTETGISENHSVSDQLVIYPNPVSGVLHIRSDSKIGPVSIFDLQGRCVVNESVKPAKEQLINVSFLNKGLFFVRVQTEKGQLTARFVKMK